MRFGYAFFEGSQGYRVILNFKPQKRAQNPSFATLRDLCAFAVKIFIPG